MTREQKPGGLEVAGHFYQTEPGQWTQMNEADGSTVALTPAEPAEARIMELEQWQANAIRSARLHDENVRELDARATAAEAKLARAVGETLDAAADYLAKQYGNSFGLDHQTDRARIVAALQQEGE